MCTLYIFMFANIQICVIKYFYCWQWSFWQNQHTWIEVNEFQSYLHKVLTTTYSNRNQPLNVIYSSSVAAFQLKDKVHLVWDNSPLCLGFTNSQLMAGNDGKWEHSTASYSLKLVECQAKADLMKFDRDNSGYIYATMDGDHELCLSVIK